MAEIKEQINVFFFLIHMISWYVICTQLYFNQFLSYNLCLNYLIFNTENKEMINKRY